MPTEFRRIVFSNEELLDALQAARDMAGGKLPAGRIVGCILSAEPSLTARLTVAPDGCGPGEPIGTESGVTVDLDPEFVGAALLLHCRRNKIPIPRNSEKSLQVVGDSLALRISLVTASLEAASSETGAPKVSAAPGQPDDGKSYPQLVREPSA